MPIITETSRALDWECGLTIHARPPASDPQATNHGLSPAEPITRVGGDRPTGDLGQAMASWACPGSSEFPSSSLAVAGGPTLVRARLTAVIRPHCRWRAAGTPQSATRRATACSWDHRGRGPLHFPRRWGAPSLRLHPHCMALQQGVQGSGSRVVCLAVGLWRNTPCRNSPSEPGKLFLFVDLHRAGSQETPPHRRTVGAGFINPDCGPHWQAAQAGLFFCCARPGWDRSCWQRSVGVDAERCGARSKQGIEAIFRAACGRAYSRTWTQRILGRYADD